MDPYVIRRFQINSLEWQDLYRKELKAWTRSLWQRRLQRFNFRLWRRQAQVRERYSSKWSRRKWPSPTHSPREPSYYSWGTEAIAASDWGMKRVHQRLLWRSIGQLKPASVLEVGSGTGINLLALSTAFPNVRWAGVELSPGGVARAKGEQDEPKLNPAIESFCSWPIEAPLAYRDIDFREGDARSLPFEDGSFDLVFTKLAIEQMEQIREEAVAEIARVASQWVVMIEPLVDFNSQHKLQRVYTKAKGYISFSVNDLIRFGLEPVLVFDDIPQKLTRGASLVVARKM